VLGGDRFVFVDRSPALVLEVGSKNLGFIGNAGRDFGGRAGSFLPGENDKDFGFWLGFSVSSLLDVLESIFVCCCLRFACERVITPDGPASSAASLSVASRECLRANFGGLFDSARLRDDLLGVFSLSRLLLLAGGVDVTTISSWPAGCSALSLPISAGGSSYSAIPIAASSPLSSDWSGRAVRVSPKRC
jgi:hypothetical protein